MNIVVCIRQILDPEIHPRDFQVDRASKKAVQGAAPLVVNPYDIEQMADAIHTAINMPPAERRDRMRRMREIVKERNVYRWAGNIISTLSRVRLVRQAAEITREGR